MRSYTPTSSDDDLGHFDLLIKVCIPLALPMRLINCFQAYEKGNISRYASLLKIGDKVKIKGPKGKFYTYAWTCSLSHLQDRHFFRIVSHDTQLLPALLISMFNFKLGQSTDVDLSSELLDASDFTPERLLTLEYAHDIAVQAFDPLTGLLAIGGFLWSRPLVLARRIDPLFLPLNRTPHLHQGPAQVLYGWLDRGGYRNESKLRMLLSNSWISPSRPTN